VHSLTATRRTVQAEAMGIRVGDPVLLNRPIARCAAPNTFSGACVFYHLYSSSTPLVKRCFLLFCTNTHTHTHTRTRALHSERAKKTTHTTKLCSKNNNNNNNNDNNNNAN
jgi:hypothetical protein